MATKGPMLEGRLNQRPIFGQFGNIEMIKKLWTKLHTAVNLFAVILN